MRSFRRCTYLNSFFRVVVVFLIISFVIIAAIPQRDLYTYGATDSERRSLLDGSMSYLGGLRAVYYSDGHSLSGLQTTSAGKPDVATFKSSGLSCCNFLTYVYFNYLKNVKGIDLSKKYSRPDKVQSSYNLAQTSSYHEWAKYLANNGLVRPLTVIGAGNYNSLRSLTYETASGASATPKVGSLVIYYSESGVTASNYKTKTPMHAAIFIGKEDGIDRVYHQSIYGNDKGKLSWMNAGYITMRSAIVFDLDIKPEEYGKARVETTFAKVCGDNVTTGNAYYGKTTDSVFGVYTTNNNGTLSGKVATIYGNGDAVRIKEGKYFVNEDTVPKGFREVALRTGTVNPDATKTWYYENVPKVESVSVVIKKQLLNGKTDPKLADTQYRVNYYAGKYTKDNLPATAKRTWLLKTDTNGLVKFDSDHFVSGNSFYLENGKPILPYGTVTITEVKNSGFVKDTEVRLINVDGQKMHFSDANAPISKTAELGGIAIKNVNQNGNPLWGAQFTVYADSALQKPLATIYSNKDGIATYGYNSSTKKFSLPLGMTYYIKQTKGYAGYTEYTKVLKAKTESGKLIYTSENAVNKRYGALGIKAADQNGSPLQGVKFGVYSDSACSTKISEMTSKSNGYAYYGYDASTKKYLLPPDKTYYIKQIGSIPGYTPSTKVFSIRVESGLDNWCTERAYNIRYGALGIKAVDQNGNPLTGVKFGIYSDSGCKTLVAQMTSKASGFAYYGYDASTKRFLLPAKKTYYIKQINSLPGYTASTKVFSIYVKSGQDNWCTERAVNIKK